MLTKEIMLMIALLPLLGIAVIGTLISLIAPPLILYLTDIIAYALASIVAVLILKKRTWKEALTGFQTFTNTVIKQSNSKEQASAMPIQSMIVELTETIR
jgi:hypothetical protein